MLYRIFISNMGDFRDSSKYEFVAEFPEFKMTQNYISYMSKKKRYQGKDIIVKILSDREIDPKEGRVDGVVSAIGENLPVDEYEFV